MSNLLIVEGKSDKVIIESLIKHLNIHLEVGNPVCSIDKCEDLGGTGELEKKLKTLKKRVRKESISKIGIIFDADKVGVEKRTEEIKIIIQSVFGAEYNVEFKIHILNIEGYGELEDILKKIVAKSPTMANCLNSWQECLNDKKLNSKELNKLWIQVYEKYDCCTKKEQENMKDNCNKDVLLNTKKIYNFNTNIKELDDLKEFLQEIGEN